MTQKRFWNYKDPDSVRDINRWMLGILPMGLYYGFDTIDLDGTLNLKIRHTNTGQIESKEDNTASNKIGKFITPQGIVVREDDFITVNGVSANASGNPRIDIVVATATFVETIGGAAVTYSIIQGTPNASPVAPALANVNTQIIIGYLYVPDGTTALNSGGVLWTRPDYKHLGNRPDNFAYLDKEETFTALQSFREYAHEKWGAATQSGSTITLPTGGSASNLYFLNSSGGNLSTIGAKKNGYIVKILNVGLEFPIDIAGNIITPQNVTTYVGNGDTFELIYDTTLSKWWLTGVGTFNFVKKNTWNIFEATQSFGVDNVLSYTPTGQKLNIAKTANTYAITGVTASTIQQLTQTADGTELTIINSLANDIVFKHNATPDVNFGAFFFPLSKDFVLRSLDNMTLIQIGGTYFFKAANAHLKRTYIRKAINAAL